MNQRRWITTCVILGFLLTSPAGARASERSETWKRGQVLAAAKCAQCHAIGRNDHSSFPEAPPFRVIAKRYPVEGLAEALAEGIYVGHPEMPVFVFPPDEIGDLLTYMDSLKE